MEVDYMLVKPRFYLKHLVGRVPPLDSCFLLHDSNKGSAGISVLIIIVVALFAAQFSGFFTFKKYDPSNTSAKKYVVVEGPGLDGKGGLNIIELKLEEYQPPTPIPTQPPPPLPTVEVPTPTFGPSPTPRPTRAPTPTPSFPTPTPTPTTPPPPPPYIPM